MECDAEEWFISMSLQNAYPAQEICIYESMTTLVKFDIDRRTQASVGTEPRHRKEAGSSSPILAQDRSHGEPMISTWFRLWGMRLDEKSKGSHSSARGLERLQCAAYRLYPNTCHLLRRSFRISVLVFLLILTSASHLSAGSVIVETINCSTELC